MIHQGNQDVTWGTVPPNDDYAERALLALVLCKLATVPQVSNLIPAPEVFFGNANQAVWRACLSVFKAGADPDTVSVATALREANRLDDVGGMSYLVGLLAEIQQSVSENNVRAYADSVRRCWVRRRLINVSRNWMAQCTQRVEDLPAFMTKAAEAIAELQRDATTDSGTDNMVAALRTMVSEMNAKGQVMPTGLNGLDAIIGGLRPKEVTIIAARTSVGKSALAVQIAKHVAQTSGPVLYISLEMQSKTLVMRMVSQESMVNTRSYMSGNMTSSEYTRWLYGCKTLAKVPITFNASQAMTVTEVMAMAEKKASSLVALDKSKLCLVVLDHIGLVRSSQKHAVREREVAEVSRSLRHIADTLGCAVLSLAQIGREAEKRSPADRIPKLYDIRESGSIEQDADTVLILHRERNSNGTFKEGIPAQLIVAKARNSGELGIAELRFEPEFTRFSDWY